MFLGGIPISTSGLDEYSDALNGAYSKGLSGCLHDLVINRFPCNFDFFAVAGANIKSCE